MKKISLILATVLAALMMASCQKTSMPSGPGYTVEIAANRFASSITTDHVILEYDSYGHLVGKNTLNDTEDGVTKTFVASPEAAYLTIRMDLEAKPSTGSHRSYFYSYMFVLEQGKTNRVVLDGGSPVQATEPVFSK